MVDAAKRYGPPEPLEIGLCKLADGYIAVRFPAWKPGLPNPDRIVQVTPEQLDNWKRAIAAFRSTQIELRALYNAQPKDTQENAA